MRLKNFFLKTSVKLHRLISASKRTERFERFLIVSTTGLGDTLWGTPAIRALRGRFPESYIGILTSPLGEGVLKNNPYLDEIFTIEDPVLPKLFPLYRILKTRVIDTAILFHVSQRPLLPFCHWIGAKEIIGTQGLCKGLDDLLTKATPSRHQHEIERRLDLIAETGAPAQGLTMEIFFQKKEERKVEQFLQKHDVPSYLPLVGLHPGAKDLFKQWFPEGFIRIGKRLAEEKGCQILVTGSGAEKDLVLQIANAIPRAIPIYGQLNIHQLAALQKRMQLLITNDTGPMHLAAAVGTPLLALFGPTDPTLCGPISGSNTEIISIPPSCSPCLKKQCRDPFCLLQINPNEVYRKALSLLDMKE